ncbi:MAG: hypothetical protein ACU0DT_10540 [Albimonas sp.]|uniref:hypothetical protein n=1 Tax=Albimonas sp. TaxID=1872425 RepID=UPI004057121D
MRLRLLPWSLAAALMLPAASASAYATFVTPVSPNPDYLYLQINWQTAATSGAVGVGDLSHLQFVVYGLDGLQQTEDTAIVDGVVQPLGNVARELSDLAFSFVLGLAPEEQHLALKSFDNNLGDISLDYSLSSPPALGHYTLLDVAGVLDEGLGLALVDIAFYAPATGGPLAPELKYAHAEVASLVTAPLPGALALLGAGLGALGLMRRRG